MAFYSLFLMLFLYGNTINGRVIKGNSNTEKTGTNSCTTPNNEPGTCISVKQCPIAVEMLKTVTQGNIDFLRKSHCGGDENRYPKVCCKLDSIESPVVNSILSRPVNSFETAIQNNSIVREANARDAFGEKQDHNSCLTPDNRLGTCINVTLCPKAVELLKNRTPENINFLRKSQCNSDNKQYPKVCCTLGLVKPAVIPFIPNSILTVNGTDNLRNHSFCGIQSPHSSMNKIIIRMDSNPGEWPWIAALGYRQDFASSISWKCGGSLISDKWVITAAHCVVDLGKLVLTTIRLGDIYLNDTVSDGASPVDVQVAQSIVHPQYFKNSPANDIALLRLTNPVNFTEYISPVCILSQDENHSDEFYIRRAPIFVGWRNTQWKNRELNVLQHESSNLVDRKTCSELYKSRIGSLKIDDRILCVNADRWGSEGPLDIAILPKTDGFGFYLDGIVSYWAENNTPAVYTRVSYYSDWILSTTGIRV